MTDAMPWLFFIVSTASPCTMESALPDRAVEPSPENSSSADVTEVPMNSPKTKSAPPPPAAPPEAPCDSIDACKAVMVSQTTPERIEAAGVWLARHADREARQALETVLGDAEVLGRLDDVDNPGARTVRLSRILAALEGPGVATLCQALAADPQFIAVPDRLVPLLQAAASERPMSGETAALFVRANQMGHAPSNIILLGRNASPNALEAFEAMLRNDAPLSLEERIEAVHVALWPVRTETAVIAFAERGLKTRGPRELDLAILETMFDDRPMQWFGKGEAPAAPRPWKDASSEARGAAAQLARRAVAYPKLPAPLEAKIEAVSAALSEEGRGGG